MEKNISYENLDAFSAAFHSSRVNTIAQYSVISLGVNKSALTFEGLKNNFHQYSVRLDNKGITNQKGSGRCWMFAALNCLRFKVIHDLNLEDFELSQNYTVFYDKLEKANYFIESVFKTLDEPTDSRLIQFLVRAPIQDGGQWDMMSALIQKYGVVPKTAMPETACSSGTGEITQLVTEKLRTYAAAIRADYKAGVPVEELYARKAEILNTVYRMLSIAFGTPPETFDFEVRTKDGQFIAERGLTPQAFYEKYVGIDLNDYISLINAPTQDKPYMRSFTVAYLGNVVGGTPVKYVNLEIDELKKAAIAQMQDGEPVWFGCDVGKRSTRDTGMMALDAYDYDGLFSTEFDLTKEEMLDYGLSMMTHAMVFQGVDLTEDGNPTRWCVENSWGDASGVKGMYLMSDAWFDKFMYQVVVNKKYLSQEILDAYNQEPIVLEPWDPMGALA